MKVTKHYADNHVVLYVTEGDLQTSLRRGLGWQEMLYPRQAGKCHLAEI